MLKNGDLPANLNAIAPNEFQAEDLGTIMFYEVGDGHISGLTLFSKAPRGITFPKADWSTIPGAISVRGPSEVHKVQIIPQRSAKTLVTVRKRSRLSGQGITSPFIARDRVVRTLRPSCKYDVHRVLDEVFCGKSTTCGLTVYFADRA
jgi:hypothetical protein